MRITIDTEQKTIEVAGNVKLGDFVKEAKKLLGESWKEYEIVETLPNWTQPISPLPYEPQPYNPWPITVTPLPYTPEPYPPAPKIWYSVDCENQVTN